jgi:tripartite-type tricarboxylate transporter receptor subunit TctC
MFHVPYKGPPPALADLIAGQVQMMFASITSSLTLARSGRLRPLAVTSRKRNATLPDIPAIAETMPGFEVVGWYGAMAPGKTPRAIVEKIAAAIAKGMRNPEIRTRVAADGSEAVGGTPQEFDRLLHSELARYAKVIKDANLRSE